MYIAIAGTHVACHHRTIEEMCNILHLGHQWSTLVSQLMLTFVDHCRYPLMGYQWLPSLGHKRKVKHSASGPEMVAPSGPANNTICGPVQVSISGPVVVAITGAPVADIIGP